MESHSRHNAKARRRLRTIELAKLRRRLRWAMQPGRFATAGELSECVERTRAQIAKITGGQI